jgi:glycosyltransferase involved in cell wall biosynthesis
VAYAVVCDAAPQIFFEIAGLLYNAWLLARLGFKLLRRRPDLLYERYALGTFAPAVLCKMLRIRHVIEINESVLVQRSRSLTLASVHRLVEKLVLSSADLLVTISSEFRRVLTNAFPALEDKIVVCPNAVSRSTVWSPLASAVDVKTRLRGSILLGSVGQFVTWHGLEPFVASMAQLARERDLGFLFIGDGPVRSDVMSAARRHRIEERVLFTGIVPHAAVQDYLAVMDIAVIPFSNMHSSPMKLAEFMAAGLPIVAPSLPPIREVLVDRVTGHLFEHGNLEDMRRRLVEVLDDMPRALQMGQRAREHAFQNLTWGHNAQIVLKRFGAG